ncbi:hypothetical protein RRG08_000121 [Elysia crispata]|uniref:Uncharacterized protein n=1 Tax=Elysia crispata TaxID=231223 RepID=A0AAE1D5J4_9GAST|nr:hypothetical protein RRG08_000121 [Elysia crispata]
MKRTISQDLGGPSCGSLLHRSCSSVTSSRSNRTMGLSVQVLFRLSNHTLSDLGHSCAFERLIVYDVMS